jgi:hypothetical protein
MSRFEDVARCPEVDSVFVNFVGRYQCRAGRRFAEARPNNPSVIVTTVLLFVTESGCSHSNYDLPPIAAIEYLEAALALADNHYLCVAVAQFDLPCRAAGARKRRLRARVEKPHERRLLVKTTWLFATSLSLS